MTCNGNRPRYECKLNLLGQSESYISLMAASVSFWGQLKGNSNFEQATVFGLESKG